jgi:hypothetical protein
MRVLILFLLLVSTGLGQNGNYPPHFDDIFFPESTSKVFYGIQGCLHAGVIGCHRPLPLPAEGACHKNFMYAMHNLRKTGNSGR